MADACYQCTERTAECHTTCQRYLERWEADRKRDEAKLIQIAADEHVSNTIRKTRKKRRMP